MDQRYPLVTIVTPSYNQASFIEETILSVLSQDYPNIEYIIVDGGSTDHTLDILKKYEENIKWISEKDHGQADGVNKGIKMATGDIIGWLNSDDTYEPGCIKKIVECFERGPDIVLVYGNGYQMSEDGKNKRPFKSKEITFKKLAKKNDILQPSVFFKKEALETIGYLNPELQLVMDFELWIRFLQKYEKQILFLPGYLSNWRLHNVAKTSLNREKIYQEIFQVLTKYYGFISSSWMVGYIAEILLGYNSFRGLRSLVFNQKGLLINALKVLVKEYGTRRAILYFSRFCVEAPFLVFHRFIMKRSL